MRHRQTPHREERKRPSLEKEAFFKKLKAICKAQRGFAQVDNIAVVDMHIYEVKLR